MSCCVIYQIIKTTNCAVQEILLEHKNFQNPIKFCTISFEPLWSKPDLRDEPAPCCALYCGARGGYNSNRDAMDTIVTMVF